MCKELIVISRFKEKDVKDIMISYNIEGEIGSLNLGRAGCKGEDLVVSIEHIDGQCLCNISLEQKARVFNFIHAISF